MQTLKGDEAKDLAKKLLNSYFKTFEYPFTAHHIDSFDQFLSEGLPSILQSRNPILIVKDLQSDKKTYKYKVEVYVGGLDGRGIYIGTPTISLQQAEEVRLLFPNEARLRNLTYGSTILVDVLVRVTIQGMEPNTHEIHFRQDTTTGLDERIPLCRMPIMLHSRYCVLHKKPAELLREAGECEYDYGGYFIVDGSEKVLITRQEQAFNTLYISNQERDPQIKQYSSISCLSPKTRDVKRIAFMMVRATGAIQVSIPFVRKPVPLFVLFRSLGIQSDKDIVRLIFPDSESAEAKLLESHLVPSILDALPFIDTFSAVQYIKVLTKGFSEAHVLDILHNQLFIHVEDIPLARATYLADLVRSMLRVSNGIDAPTNRDDTRNQRCLTSGFLTQMLFQGLYVSWTKKVALAIDTEYAYKKQIYENEKFLDIFLPGNRSRLFPANILTDGMMRGFKGKWASGPGGEEKAGVLQSLSRLSYHDFLSHCRRVVLDFDTSMKLPGPRRLNPSQYGYFCTSETPTGGSIGITKNLSIMAHVSTGTNPLPLIQWLLSRGGVINCESVNEDVRKAAVPVFINGGIVGYTLRPGLLRDVLKLFKWTGCLPAFTSIGFSMRDRRVFIYLDEGRPLRPLIHLGQGGSLPIEKLTKLTKWRDLVMGVFPLTAGREISTPGFLDPLKEKERVSLDEYIKLLEDKTGAVEYVDPYEQNETYIANFPEYIVNETSHLEIHPSTILGLMTSMIPFPNHNQSPRNQLSCSQSKQGLSIYSTNYQNRFDNQVHVLCYGEAPLCRTLYYDYVADGKIGYGHNLILAIGSFTGYNQDDGIVMNKDALDRGMFRSMSFRSYEAFEEDDDQSETQTRIANPARVPGWTDLKPGIDYTKLDDRGLIKEGEYVDQHTVIVGRYLRSKSGQMRDASVTPQVWTRGRVEKIVITVSNTGLRLVKIKVTQDRVPELGDKFSNRHGQKGTLGMAIHGCDMPRTIDGVVPDMIMNPHAIPSRMTIAQLLETIFGKAATSLGAIANGTSFMNDGDPSESIGNVLEQVFGMERYGNEILYDGTTGVQIPSTIFIGQCYTMRLKHMTEDKWNARGQGRREQRTHQPTGGRGAEGGLRIGEMECWALQGHGITKFFQESLMKRADGTEFIVCNGCGTIPITNKEGMSICPLCDGPVRYSGDSVSNLEILPPNKRSLATYSKIEMPYVVKLLEQELSTYMNIGMRYLTAKDVQQLPTPSLEDLEDEQLAEFANMPLPQYILPETSVPEILPPIEVKEIKPEDLSALGIAAPIPKMDAPVVLTENERLEDEIESESLPPLEQFQPQAQQQQQQPQQQQQQQMMVPMMVPMMMPQQQPQVQSQQMYSAAPGAPPLLVVDTSQQAMEANGFTAPPMGQLPTRTANNQTRRAPRSVRFQEPQQQQQQQPQQQANVRVTINKLG
jgi:DNA-directed RNA polymerase II subunit RPB2